VRDAIGGFGIGDLSINYQINFFVFSSTFGWQAKITAPSDWNSNCLIRHGEEVRRGILLKRTLTGHI
jgi:hypothetical protein